MIVRAHHSGTYVHRGTSSKPFRGYKLVVFSVSPFFVINKNFSQIKVSNSYSVSCVGERVSFNLDGQLRCIEGEE
jgi:hypothetical protein